jgi:hypothetical protein
LPLRRPVTASPRTLYRNALFETVPHRIEGCSHAEAHCRDGIWLPHQVLLAEPGWIDSVVHAIGKVRMASATLSRM